MNTPRRHIVFLDILGFQHIVDTTPPEQILGVYKDVEKIIADDIEMRRAFSKKMNEMAGGNTYIAPITDLECRFFSDTILIYSKNNVEDSLYEADHLCALMIRVYNHLLLRHSWLVRGAFATGELYVDGNAIFGKDLIRAYKAEQEQEWAAIIVLDKTDIMYNPYSLFTCDYPVPTKSGVKDGTVLNFFVDHESPVPFYEHLKKLISLRQGQQAPPVVKKLDNTLALFEHLITRGVSAKARTEKMTAKDFELQTKLFPHMGPLCEYIRQRNASPLIVP